MSVTLLGGCDSNLAIGSWVCAGPSSETSNGVVTVGQSPATISVAWSTGFEDGFCDYSILDGYCYASDFASYEIVSSPVHSGRFAAAFTVTSDETLQERQTRCVRHGALPSAAYYGAWYYIPSYQTSTGNWNLFHFQGRNTLQETYHSLWDLSLFNDRDGDLHLAVFNFLEGRALGLTVGPPIPIGSWFHLQIYLKRARDATGEVTVYQDGMIALRLTNLVTDDTEWGQWYVGNLATALSPTTSTVYVDDVSIGATL